MCFRNFNGSPEKPARSCDGPTTMPPPCHPSATNHHPTPLGHETHDFLHVAINNYLVFSLWVWDQKTIYIYIYLYTAEKSLRPTRPQCKNKKHVFSKKRRMLTSSTSRSWINKNTPENWWRKVLEPTFQGHAATCNLGSVNSHGCEHILQVNTALRRGSPEKNGGEHWISGKGEQKSLEFFFWNKILKYPVLGVEDLRLVGFCKCICWFNLQRQRKHRNYNRLNKKRLKLMALFASQTGTWYLS